MKTDTNGILKISYPEIEKQFNRPEIVNKYKRLMGDFLAKRREMLYSSTPSKQIYYSNSDIESWFSATGVNKSVIHQGIKETYYYKIAAFNPRYAKDESTIALLCLIRYFFINKKETETNLAMINLAISGKYYPSIFYKSYKFAPAQHVMEYVINKMLTQKYEFAKQGTVMGTLKSITTRWLETYKDRFMQFNDEDVCYLLQQLHNRIDSFIHNIAVLYYEAYDRKDSYITYDSDAIAEDKYRLADNDSFKASNIVSAAASYITSKGIDYITCKRASNDIIKMDELAAIIEHLITDKRNIPILKEFMMILVSLYFQQSKYKDISDINFISFSIKPTPNTHNPYVLRKKELLDLILLNNSENFQRRRSRVATESAYYRAFTAYITLIIQKANAIAAS